MPENRPDTSRSFEPRISNLDSCLRLWRIHSNEFAANEFNPTVPTDKSGGRFDTLAGDYAYLYAGSDVKAAVAETLLRDRPPEKVYYQIPDVRIRGKSLSEIRLRFDLEVVKLHGNGPAAIGQEDNWITSCSSKYYPITREWASAIRGWAPGASGIVYRPRHDNDRFAYVFFDDRCPDCPFETIGSKPIDMAGPGAMMIRDAVMDYNALFKL